VPGKIRALFVLERFLCGVIFRRKLPNIDKSLSTDIDFFLRNGGRCRESPKPRCRLQGFAGKVRNLAADCRASPGKPETLLQIAGLRREDPKPHCKLQGSAGKVRNLAADCRAAPVYKAYGSGTLILQDHGNLVSYRKI
jgi:hypothetical protein